MRISNRTKKGTYEVGFEYHSDLEVYITLMSDIPKLCEIHFAPHFKKLVHSLIS